jgi:hypothetical protein
VKRPKLPKFPCFSESATNEDTNRFVRDLFHGGEREAVIVGVAIIDSALTDLLKDKLLPPLDGEDLFNRNLSDFCDRINLAFRIGLIDEDFAQCLHCMREIRNQYAHIAQHVSLDD